MRELALAKGAGSQLPTARELCTQLQTSSATLTAALDLLESEQILCRKERQGVFVADTLYQRTIHIIFNISNMSNIGQSPFWSLLWVKLLEEAEQNAAFKNEQYRFHFLCIDMGQPLPDDYITLLSSAQVDGFLLIGLNARDQEHRRLLSIPHVTFAGGGDITIQIDQQEAGRLAARHLIQLGCKKIACWMPTNTNTDIDIINAELLKQVVAEQNATVYPEFFRSPTLPPSVNRKEFIYQEQGYMLAREVFSVSNDNRPDGLYITDDMLTSGALVALEELGIRIGKDINIVTYANAGSPILFGRTKQMAVVEIDTSDIVHAMFSLLDAAINKGYEPEDTIINIRPHLSL
ncbi:hypothetical protein KDA_64600 [Dictyobacter alpinus]|uniref:Uncharacterized protein n=1 Tax=Dictyobacter alpinus TaxID=2014873 RepID=A0A402BI22_9CHLR|nr:substrate-binding domain-containing protein [Dictyobacter alpinus]GCE30976.1 hypothetical protein KDA_64600 [Dictyobacter alpinus]